MPARSSMASADPQDPGRAHHHPADTARAMTVLIPDAHPGYVTWEQFEHNQKLLASNAYAHSTDRAAGPAREGPALLQGLAVCGRCGRRMSIRYHQRRDTLVPDYR